MKQLTLKALFKIREGNLEAFKELIPEFIRTTRSKDPGTLTYDWYLNEESLAFSVIEVYRDSPSLLAHAGNVGPLLQETGELSDLSLELYGDPDDELKNALAGMEVEVNLFPYYAGL